MDALSEFNIDRIDRDILQQEQLCRWLEMADGSQLTFLGNKSAFGLAPAYMYAHAGLLSLQVPRTVEALRLSLASK